MLQCVQNIPHKEGVRAMIDFNFTQVEIYRPVL